MQTIIFSDLDGTLLDAADYSIAAALPALGEVRKRAIPLVICSSKTRAEIEKYRVELENSHPFVTENGGGIFIPRDYFNFQLDAEPCGEYRLIRLGAAYAEIRREFVRLREQTGARVRGFGDMQVGEVAQLTGLSAAQARLAMQRDFDETFIFDGKPDERFLRAIREAGRHWTRGQFFHMMGNHDKGRAVDMLISLYRKSLGEIYSIGLGDSLNDLPMLEAVDQPVLVCHRDGTHETEIDFPRLIKTVKPGPQGWHDAVLALI